MHVAKFGYMLSLDLGGGVEKRSLAALVYRSVDVSCHIHALITLLMELVNFVPESSTTHTHTHYYSWDGWGRGTQMSSLG